MKVICPCVECIHNGNNYRCQAEKVSFAFRNMLTVNEGRVNMWICKQYELSDLAKEIDNNMREFMEDYLKKQINKNEKEIQNE